MGGCVGSSIRESRSSRKKSEELPSNSLGTIKTNDTEELLTIVAMNSMTSKRVRSLSSGDEDALVIDRRRSSAARSKLAKRHRIKRKPDLTKFRGLLAPVFTCFQESSSSILETKYVMRYAKWLKLEGIAGVLVNGVSGEGPLLGVKERKLNTEAWVQAALKYDLIIMIQISGCPLPDVIELAEHAQELDVNAVVCLPELFYSPRDVRELVGYCKIIAAHCSRTPFIYYHIPRFTDIEFDMAVFCEIAESNISNFMGLQFSDRDLHAALRCLTSRRIILCGVSSLLAPALILGFKAGLMTFLNTRPDLGFQIYEAIISKNLQLAKIKQAELNHIIVKEVTSKPIENFTGAMKNWFNKEMFSGRGAGFLAGPARKFF